jgi:cytochrome-b5 reductase
MYTTLYFRKLGHSFAFRRLVHSAAPPPQVKLRIRSVYYIFAGFAGASILGAVTYFNVSNKPLLLEPSRFTPTKLSSSEICRDTDYKSIELQLPDMAHPTSVPKPIWSVYVKDHDIQIERPFTPINPLDETGRLKFWVKRYEHGEMGRWLCAQPVGQSIEIRGPIQTLDWPQEQGKWDHVLMVHLLSAGLKLSLTN